MLNDFKKACDSTELERFTSEMEPIVAEINADEGRKAGDNAKLLELMKARDVAAGRRVHPLFKRFEARHCSAIALVYACVWCCAIGGCILGAPFWRCQAMCVGSNRTKWIVARHLSSAAFMPPWLVSCVCAAQAVIV